MQQSEPSASSRNSSLILYLIVRVIGTFIYQMISVAVGWQVYSLTHSAFALGLVGLVQFAPLVLFMLVVGYAADHLNRKIILIVSQAFVTAAFVILAVGSYRGFITYGWILVIVFFMGTANSFQGTAMQSILPNIVKKEEFTKAAAGASSVSQAAMVLGPALGGVLYAAGPATVYTLCAGASVLSISFICFLQLRQRTIEREPVTLKSLLMGFSYISSRPVILGAISLDLFVVLFGGATALLPIYASTILHTGSLGLGALRSAPAVGAMLVSFYLSRRPLSRRVGKALFAAVVIFGVATIVFAVSRSFVLSFAALVLLGGSDVVSVVVRTTLVQIETPDSMRGRVNSVNQLFIGTSNQLGEFESGLTASWFGAVKAAVIGGVGSIVVAVLWLRLFPQLFKVKSFHYDGR